ncbi:hypothetical protein ACLBNB_19740 [Pseudomonas chlororaphis subsp. aurantiaca]|uniref:hypothetical protein n=1 Tax=Pseudomonas chlororaphis TaxID=587753 RepID=UPI00398B7014
MSEPWKELLAALWNSVTAGRRWLAILFVLLGVVIPGVFGLVTFYASTFASLSSYLSPKVSVLTNDEENLRNEWIAVVAFFPSEQAAREQLSRFKSLYEKYETEQRQGSDGPYALWRDDIVVARDPEKTGRWIIAVDMYYGPSAAPIVSAELARIAHLGGSNSEAQNTYQKIFVSSKVLCYAQNKFEETYGHIEPVPAPKVDQENTPYAPCSPSNA